MQNVEQIFSAVNESVEAERRAYAPDTEPEPIPEPEPEPDAEPEATTPPKKEEVVQKIILKLAKYLISFVEGYHVAKNGGGRKKK